MELDKALSICSLNHLFMLSFINVPANKKMTDTGIIVRTTENITSLNLSLEPKILLWASERSFAKFLNITSINTKSRMIFIFTRRNMAILEYRENLVLPIFFPTRKFTARSIIKYMKYCRTLLLGSFPAEPAINSLKNMKPLLTVRDSHFIAKINFSMLILLYRRHQHFSQKSLLSL